MFKAASVSALLNAFLMTMQIAIGTTAHSDGLVADGIHTLSDLAADGVVLLVLFIGARGHQRSARSRASGTTSETGMQQALASFIIAGVLIATAGNMLWDSFAQTSTPGVGVTIQICALAVSGFVTLAKEALFRYMHAAARRNGSALLVASAWHARVDAVSALVATVGIAGALAGLPVLDQAAGALIGLMILRMGYVIGRDALRQIVASVTGSAAAGQTAD